MTPVGHEVDTFEIRMFHAPTKNCYLESLHKSVIIELVT